MEEKAMTVHVMIRYTVAPDKVAEQEAALRDFLAEVRAAGDAEAEYTSYKLDDTNFVHVGRFADDDAVKRFQALSGFKPFADGMRERASDGPHFTKPECIASSRW
jgi:quinol monooxygenase YgiN